MELELGLTYTVIKTDGTKITFTFLGGYPTIVKLSTGQKILFDEILMGGYQSYWEEND